MKYYRDKNLMPTLLVCSVGSAVLIAMVWLCGLVIFRRWYFYPSLFFVFFSMVCLKTGIAEVWHRRVWKACQWWSGIWLLIFALSFSAPPFSLPISLLILPIAVSGKIGPFTALFVHLLIWGCATDLLKKWPQDHSPS